MDQTFEQMESLLTTIQGKLEQQQSSRHKDGNTFHSSMGAPEMLIKPTELDADFTRKPVGRIRRRTQWERSPK
eukprot:335942-Ditylum_brightwellii.AAC.1